MGDSTAFVRRCSPWSVETSKKVSRNPLSLQGHAGPSQYIYLCQGVTRRKHVQRERSGNLVDAASLDV
jgi:hypothetical protein